MGTLPFIRDLTNLTYYSFETWFTKDTTAGFEGAGGALDYPAIHVVKDFGGTSYDGRLKPADSTGPDSNRDRFSKIKRSNSKFWKNENIKYAFKITLQQFTKNNCGEIF